MQALEIRRLGLVAGADQRFETSRHQRGQAPAQHHLLAEEVRLGLLVEGRVEYAGPGGADGVRIGQGELTRLAGGVLMDGDQRRNSAALGVGAPDEVTRALGRHHGDVDARRRHDLPEADVEAVSEHEAVAVIEVRRHELVVGRLLLGVGQQHHDHVGLGGGVGQRQHAQSGLLSLALAAAACAQRHPDVHPGLTQVLRVRVPLGAVAQDRHLAAGDQRRVGIGFVVHRGHVVCSFSLFSRSVLSLGLCEAA